MSDTRAGAGARGGLPQAAYLVLASRLVPGLDGGFAVAVAARARMLAERGADVAVLTVDPGAAAAHAAHRAELVRRGMLPAGVPLRNLFDEAAAPGGGAADWLVTAAARPRSRRDGSSEPGSGPGRPLGPSCGHGEAGTRTVADAAGRPLVDLPVLTGDPDWHLTDAPVVVRDGAGEPIGAVAGFGALYRVWLAHVVAGLRAEDPDRPVIVLCEARQLGELIVGALPAGVRLVHTVHTSHLEPPYGEDAPVNALWSRWFGIADRFDAVVWPTAQQRDEVVRRFGLAGRHDVVPHAVVPAARATATVPGRVLMVNRLAPGKRVDLAIRAFAAVAAADAEAHLVIVGEGPERAALEALIADLGLAGRVELAGATDDVPAELDRASVFLTTSAYEGQGLAIAEALAHGVPVVAFDIRYGPRDMVRDAAEPAGILVPDGDLVALSGALTGLLADGSRRARMSVAARAATARIAPDAVVEAWSTVFLRALRG